MSLLIRINIASTLLLITPVVVFGQISEINKTTGWYMTNECFQGQVDVTQTPYCPYRSFSSSLMVVFSSGMPQEGIKGL